jgi:hypothetical protein
LLAVAPRPSQKVLSALVAMPRAVPFQPACAVCSQNSNPKFFLVGNQKIALKINLAIAKKVFVNYKPGISVNLLQKQNLINAVLCFKSAAKIL